MATKQQPLIPLIYIQNAEFAKQFEHGVWWSMYGDEQGAGPQPASYLVTNLKVYAERDYFNKRDPFYRHHIGFFIGMYHGGVLSQQTRTICPNVYALAILDHEDAVRGYDVGREFFLLMPNLMSAGIPRCTW